MLVVRPSHRLLVTAVVLAGAAVAAPSASAIALKNNVESPLLRYGACSYRLQAGTFGGAAYVQLKLRNRSCTTSGQAISTVGSGGDYPTYSYVMAVGLVNRPGDTKDRDSQNVRRPGPSLTQATVPNNVAWRGGFMVCRKRGTGGIETNRCAYYGYHVDR